MTLNDILNEQRIYAMINDVPILRESEVHLFEELIGLYRPTSVLEVGTAIGYSALLMAPLLDEEEGHITSIELQGDVEKIPESIDIDVSNMNFDNRILLEDISIPKDISVLSDPKALLAIITN